MKKYIALIAITIVAIAIMIGAQSTLAVKPDPVTLIAKGNVTEVGFVGKPFDLWPRVPASGPWKLVVNLKTHHVSFTATCQDTSTRVVYKLSYIGPYATVSGLGTDVVTITVPSMTVKTRRTSLTCAAEDTEIIIKPGLIVDIYDNTNENVYGKVTRYLEVPDH